LNSNLTENLFHTYQKYFESRLSNKRFTHTDILPLIKNAGEKKILTINLLGHSIEQREIVSLEYGEGETTILLWSQMHGDEPTATMALFDIFNFFNTAEDGFDDLRTSIKKNLRLIFVPMLNPDGAERIIRQNAAGIDLNRDAMRSQSPESKILIELVEKYKPDFAFNLHDQDFRWAVGTSDKLAAISLLAPVYDYDKSINQSRSKAIKLIADLRSDFEKYLPGQIARYKDDFEPRSFGDIISGRNTSTILIECGRDRNDSNKAFHRKLNFMMLLSAFNKIIIKGYEERSENEYFAIPTNGNFMFDLILRNVKLPFKNLECVVDMAINREEIYEGASRVPKLISSILDIGDLSTLKGLEEYDCTGLVFKEGKISDSTFNSLSELDETKIGTLLEQGILFVRSDEEFKTKRYSNIPINLLRKSSNFFPKTGINSPANFNFTKHGKVVMHVINGWLCDLGETEQVKNGLIF